MLMWLVHWLHFESHCGGIFLTLGEKIVFTISLKYLTKGHFKSRVLTSLRWPAAAAAKSLQSCPTLCDPIDGSPPGSPIPGILQARTLEWVAISFSNAWKWKVKVKSLSRVRLLASPWTAAYQAPLSMGFSRQEYWSGVPLPSPYTDLVHPQLPVNYKLVYTHCKRDIWAETYLKHK